MSTYKCYYCPENPSCFKNIIQHLCHKDDEIRVRQFDRCQMRTINFKALSDLFQEQGRTITIDEIKEKIHITKANIVPKDSPLKLVRLEGNSSYKDSDDPLSKVVSGEDLIFTEESVGTDLSSCSDDIDDSGSI